MAFSDIIQRSLQEDPVKRPTMDDVVLGQEKALNYCQAIIMPPMGNCPREINHPFHMDQPLVLAPSPPTNRKDMDMDLIWTEEVTFLMDMDRRWFDDLLREEW